MNRKPDAMDHCGVCLDAMAFLILSVVVGVFSILGFFFRAISTDTQCETKRTIFNFEPSTQDHDGES
jgi:hypothetical protein